LQVKSRWDKIEGFVARIDDTRNVYKILVGKPEGDRQLEKSSRRREDNMRLSATATGVIVDWINLARDVVHREAAPGSSDGVGFRSWCEEYQLYVCNGAGTPQSAFFCGEIAVFWYMTPCGL
jgi:hypothetical protein